MYFCKSFVCFLFALSDAVRIYSSYTNTFCEQDVLYGTIEYFNRNQEITRMIANVETGYEVDLYLLSPILYSCNFASCVVTDHLDIVVVDQRSQRSQSTESTERPQNSGQEHQQEIETRDEEYEDLSDDLRNNIDENLDLNLIIVQDLSELSVALRYRMVRYAELVDVEMSIEQDNDNLLLNGVTSNHFPFTTSDEMTSERQTRIRLQLHSLATRNRLRIRYIDYTLQASSGITWTVTLMPEILPSTEQSSQRVRIDRFILMARAATRNIIRVVL